MNVASEDLQKGYGMDPAPLPSNRAIIEEYREAHNGEEPSMEHVFGKLLKRAREYSVGHVQGTLPPKSQPSESMDNWQKLAVLFTIEVRWSSMLR